MGIDPNHSGLVEVSRKTRRNSRGIDSPNALFLLGAWEELPGPFAGKVRSASVLFPWGSLLRAVGKAEPEFVRRISGLSAPAPLTIDIVTALHPIADASELKRLGVEGLTAERMRDAWRASGAFAELQSLGTDHAYQTTWWRKIKQREGREPTLLRVTLP